MITYIVYLLKYYDTVFKKKIRPNERVFKRGIIYPSLPANNEIICIFSFMDRNLKEGSIPAACNVNM